MKRFIDFIIRERIAVFLSISLVSMLIYFGLFTLLWHTTYLSYRVSLSIAYICAATFYFFGHRGVTFKNHTNSMHAQLIKYLAMLGVNYLIILLIVTGFVEASHFTPYLGMFIALLATTVSSYLLNRYWIFVEL